MDIRDEPSVDEINEMLEKLHPAPPQTFGERVRAERRDAGITQRELAKIIGVDFTYISKIENNRLDGVGPSENVIRAIARALAWDEEEALRLTDHYDWRAEAERLQAYLEALEPQEVEQMNDSDNETKEGRYIGARRKAADWSFGELARRSGLSKGHIYALEHGIRSPSVNTLDKIARAFGLRAGDLLVAAGYTNGKADAKQEAIFDEIRTERIHQDFKWGEQNHDHFIWLAILTEEVGEIAQAMLVEMLAGKPGTQVHQELIQTAAVCIAWLECLERNK